MDAKDIVDNNDHPRAMYKWSNKDNQKRMINPIVGASHIGSYPPWDEQSSFFHQANEYPQGQMVRIYCDSNSYCLFASQGDVAVLALGYLHDPQNNWTYASSWGHRVSDEAIFLSFSLENHALFETLGEGIESDILNKLQS